MKVSSLKATAFLSAAIFAASVGTANAASVDTDNAKCRATNAKNSSKLASTISKAFDGCIKTAVKNGSGSCVTTAGADTKGKVPGAKQKTLDGITSSCDDTGTAVALAEHQLCGTPVGGAAITGFAQVGPCLNQLVDENVARWRNALLAPNYAAALADTTKLSGKCINAIAKNATKYLSTIQKEQSKAVNSADKLGGDSNYVNLGDPSGKIAAAAVKVADGITKACGTMTADQWGIVRTCDDDLAGVIDCVQRKTQAIAEGLIASAYDQPGTCPTSVKVQIHHDASNGGDLGPTELDVGWTGFGHNAGLIDDFIGSVKLNCGAAPDDCTSCTVTAGCDTGNCRCSNDVTDECSVAFGVGVAAGCTAGNTCRVYFGPPLPLSAAGTPTCVINEITAELNGNANLATGESDTPVQNRATVFTGIAQDKPCPTCVGGLCSGGQRNGLVCTVDGISEKFGPVSYDCPPTTLSNISGAGLKINLDLTDDAIALPFALPCDPPLGALDCSCSVCSVPGNPNAKDPSNTSCNSEAECDAALGVTSTCMLNGLHSGAPRVPNNCNDGTCEVLSGEEGVCTGDSDLFCDGFTKANGEGILPCTSNADCGTYGVGSPGSCTLSTSRKCFLDPIEADGIPGTEGAVLVSTFCSAPTASGAVNAAAGTPGPSRLALDFEFFGRCSDGSPWGPGGANCQ